MADAPTEVEGECREFVQSFVDVVLPLEQRYKAVQEQLTENQDLLWTSDSEVESRAAFERMKVNAYELGALWNQMADSVLRIGPAPQELAVPVDRYVQAARQASRAWELDSDEQLRQLVNASVDGESAVAQIVTTCPGTTP